VTKKIKKTRFFRVIKALRKKRENMKIRRDLTGIKKANSVTEV
jgi:hypothetical protein